MPEKRNEVVEQFDASQLMPDIYESWLKKQPAGNARAKAGFISAEEEDKIDLVEDAHEKAKRRKRNKRRG